MSEIQLQEKCDSCGGDLWRANGYGNFGGLCWDCLEDLRYSNVEYPTPKMYIERNFMVKAGKYNNLQLLHFIDDCKRILYDEIKREVTEADKFMAVVISEYDRCKKLDEIISESGRVNIKLSYFFTNNPMECQLNHEDKDKEFTVIWNENIKY